MRFRYFHFYSFDNDDMKSSKRHVILLSLIFLLKRKLALKYGLAQLRGKEWAGLREADWYTERFCQCCDLTNDLKHLMSLK